MCTNVICIVFITFICNRFSSGITLFHVPSQPTTPINTYCLAPYILYLGPFHLDPCNLPLALCASYTVLHALCMLFYRTSCIFHCTPGTLHLVICTLHLVICTLHLVLCTLHFLRFNLRLDTILHQACTFSFIR